MEGYLLLPPERGTIIGRAVWKPRFIVLGSAVQQPITNETLPRSMSSSRLQAARKGLKNATSKPNLIDTLHTGSDPQTYLTVYKHQGDAEPLHRIPTSSIKSCEIQSMQYRKQGPAVPTLVVNLELDAAAEKLRKRRSSRAASISVMAAPLEQLLFRTVHEEHYTIHDWRANLRSYLGDYKAVEQNHNPMSPITPVSPSFNKFTNPFSPTRPSTATARPELIHRMSNLTYISTQSTRDRDRPSAIISPSPSLRSRRSDLSSQASSHPSHPAYTYQNNTPNTLPTDLPSPSYAYDDQSVEGWTISQGRSSALSNHTRGSNSVASTPSIIPRESILDRALQMRSMSVSQQTEEEQSSIARFEAMMREIEERKNKGKSVLAAPSTSSSTIDAESEDSENDDLLGEDEGLAMNAHNIPTPAQRALEYISGRTTPQGLRPMSPNSQRNASISSSIGLQPRPRDPRPRSMAPSPTNLSPASSSPPPTSTSATSIREKRTSSSSSKRLSFNEFTRRLSSTSSLLLVQTNASLSSSSGSIERGSSEASFTGEEESINQKGLRHSSLGGRERCNWRGSVGVFGSEGGFL